MAQDQELIGLQNRLASNLEWQEIKKCVIKETEQELITLENEQEEIEKDIISLQVLNEITQEEKEQAFNNTVNDILKDIDIELDKNEQGETIQ